ncbi:protein translocase subunit SecDF [Bacteroidales bacterium OttesenSCG-928-K03]|nr:protein translocase subunit SecDF [Odoribacter sp. OttesenSCG-928-L07]MDL2240464.1 protein translocase subunit SecDF [Bacteroidales bacterium OttesenSCG-928-K22]MDL2242698.1 protein translocase subunit SecDF [Bacteroidales bacterium OttesenSCG-928-K03]
MQIKGAIKFFAILLALVCLFQLSFTVVTRVVENKAEKYSKSEYVMKEYDKLKSGNELQDAKTLDSLHTVKKEYYIDSISTVPVYNILVKKYTYAECKSRELNLGLDLKGGMNVMMEVAVVDVIEALSHNSMDPTFRKAIELANQRQENSQLGYLQLFYEAYQEVDPSAQLAGIFAYEFKDKGITTTSTNAEVYRVLEVETKDAIDRSYRILRTRIDKFGVAQPNIQSIPGTGRISIELPGVKDAARVRKLLQGTASLEFWETHKFSEIYPVFIDANNKLALIESANKPSETPEKEPITIEEEVVIEETITPDGQEKTELESAITEEITTEEDNDQSLAEWESQNPLFRYLMPAFYTGEDGRQYPSENAAIGSAFIKDTATVNSLLRKVDLPRDIKLAWTNKPEPSTPNMLQLVALKVTSRDGKAPLTGEIIADARQDYDQYGQVEVTMIMTPEPGARLWKNLTAQNIGRQVAVVLDGYVYTYPVVRGEIAGGRSSISGGGMTVEEAQDIATVLKAGKLPAPARIIQEEIVGPSLGQHSIKWGMISFAVALILVMLTMAIYYNKSGWIANVALLCNVFFIIGILASIGAVLTLPGIAGIVLTIGMAVDANVIIYERIKEELKAGKGIKLAIDDGYKNAYSAIIDGNITTLITAIVLFYLGTGPVKGFATTLIIGILCSLFTSIFITRLIYNRALSKKRDIKLSRKFNTNWFTNVNFDFIGKRKIFYIITLILMIIGGVSLATRGLSFGIDFAGGRSYVVRFDQDVNTVDIANALSDDLESTPEVKTFGPNKQVKITTKYKVNNSDAAVEDEITRILYDDLKPFFTSEISYEDFATEGSEKYMGILTVTKVGPTIAKDMTVKSIWAVAIALLGIFLYIVLRFRRWQFALSGVLSLAHDAFITISCYSLFFGILPFNLDIDQTFIAAILTIIGYSINACVVIFDRDRENIGLYPKRSFKENLNSGVNSTLARSVMTSFTTIIVLLAIFILGGESIRGMAFALLVGITVGTYSSVCLSSGLVYDFTRRRDDVSKLGKVSKKDEAIMSQEANK